MRAVKISPAGAMSKGFRHWWWDRPSPCLRSKSAVASVVRVVLHCEPLASWGSLSWVPGLAQRARSTLRKSVRSTCGRAHLGQKGLWLREVVGPAARLDGIDATDRALRGRAGIHVELVAQMREPHAAGAQSLASPIQQWGSVRIDASDVCLSCLQAHHIGHARTNCSRCSSRAACNASDFLSTGSPRDA